MPDQVKRVVDPIKARWDILTPQQRYKLLAVIAVVLVALALTAFLAFRTRWTVLVYREDWRTVTEMQNALNDAGIRNESIANGQGLRVDRRRVEEARAAIEISGAAPNSEHFRWADALDTGLGTTDAERRQLNILGTEGAIERLLTAMHGISNADVTLAIPNTRPFQQNAPQPSASVIITRSQDFSPLQGRDLALLVARSVTDLELENIIIMDQFARSVWNGAESAHDDPVGSAQQAQDQQRNQALMGLKQVMSSGFDEVFATLNYSFDDTLMTEEIRDIFEVPEGMDGGGIPHLDIGSRQGMEGGMGALEPGLGTNNATWPITGYTMPGGGPMSAYARDWERHYSINLTRHITQSGPGWIIPEESSLAVTVITDYHVYQELWMADEEGRTQADWERFKAANRATIPLNSSFEPFDYWHSIAAAAVGIPEENVELLVLQRIVTHDLPGRGWDIPTILMVAVLLLLMAMLIYGLLRRQRAAGEDEESLEPQLAVEDLLVSTQLEEAREEAAQELEEIDYFKENEIKKHIEKFVNEKPEAVAALLRNWINVEEW